MNIMKEMSKKDTWKTLSLAVKMKRSLSWGKVHNSSKNLRKASWNFPERLEIVLGSS